MTELDKKWHQQYEKLVEFKRKNGHCIVTRGYKEDKSLGYWVSKQRRFHTNNTMQPDRKELLDEIGFVWKADNDLAVWRADRTAAHVPDEDKKWHQHYEKLVEFKQKNDHCIVPQGYKEDKAFGVWVARQRTFNTKKKMRQDRKELLDELGFVWKVDNLSARSSTTNDNVRGLVIGSFYDLVRSFIFLTLVLFLLGFCV
jgi:uncharacterized protein YbgA (DUF1722 family)